MPNPTPKPENPAAQNGRRALRLSRPDSSRFITLMLVFSHKTFRWSVSKKGLSWMAGSIAGVWAIAMIGSGYGFWATKKIMSFDRLQKETQEQQNRLRSTLDQATGLEGEINALRKQHEELLHLLDPKVPPPRIPPMPGRPDKSHAQTESGPKDATAQRLSKLKMDIEKSESAAVAIRAQMAPIIDAWIHTPSIPPTAGYLSSGFGVRLNPFAGRDEAEGGFGFHSGLDITNAEGTPIQATADGVVESAGWMDRYGYAVVLKHNEDLETLYGHMARWDVQAGQTVHRGDILGKMGQSGHATGVHLHYEVRLRGKPVNPTQYLRLQREWLSTLGGQP
ncbi:MAG: M23 family metallopeptidase [Holophagaceae bacterium]|nr:M23 family metallopeptidase [Holophagaceae bacterium]